MINKFKLDQDIQIDQWITHLKNMKIKDSSEILKTFINKNNIYENRKCILQYGRKR